LRRNQPKASLNLKKFPNGFNSLTVPEERAIRGKYKEKFTQTVQAPLKRRRYFHEQRGIGHSEASPHNDKG
jgi:hypothetical protein